MRRRGMRKGRKRRPETPKEAPLADKKSRSQVKRESLGLQKMGEELSQLPERMIWQLGISEEMTEAILGIKAFGPGKVRKRQIQFVGKLLRSMGEDALKELRINFNRMQHEGVQTEREVEKS